jgi:hypothetical protein
LRKLAPHIGPEAADFNHLRAAAGLIGPVAAIIGTAARVQ